MKLTKRDVDDVYRLDFGSGTAPIILSEEEMDELRAHLQAERDEQLGRWRDPENPDCICYPVAGDPDDIWVVYEGSGLAYLRERNQAFYAGNRFSEVARRYFAAHPEPKPWEDAQPGEVWLVTLRHCEPQICQVLKTRRFLPIQTEAGYQRPTFPLDHPTITAGRRIWPEGGTGE